MFKHHISLLYFVLTSMTRFSHSCLTLSQFVCLTVFSPIPLLLFFSLCAFFLPFLPILFCFSVFLPALFHLICDINHFYPRVSLSIRYTEAHFCCLLCTHSVEHQSLQDAWVHASYSQVLLPPVCKCFRVCWSQTHPEKLRVTKRTAARSVLPMILVWSLPRNFPLPKKSYC